MSDKKVVSYKLEGANLVIGVDPNGDGEAVLEVKVNGMEALQEIMALFGKKAE